MSLTPDQSLAILGLAVTLSAYLSAIRLYAIQKIQDLPDEDKEKKKEKKLEIQKKLGWLTLADAPMVISAFLLGINLIWNPLTGMTTWEWFLPVGLSMFLFAGMVMVIQHFLAWYKTLYELKKLIWGYLIPVIIPGLIFMIVMIILAVWIFRCDGKIE